MDIFGTVVSAIELGLKLKECIDAVKHNQEAYTAATERITSSLERLEDASKSIQRRSSPALHVAVKKLHTDLSDAVQTLQQEQDTPKSILPQVLKQLLQKDQTAEILRDIESQIANCFQEFQVVASIRIEGKLDFAHEELSAKLDQVLLNMGITPSPPITRTVSNPTKQKEQSAIKPHTKEGNQKGHKDNRPRKRTVSDTPLKSGKAPQDRQKQSWGDKKRPPSQFLQVPGQTKLGNEDGKRPPGSSEQQQKSDEADELDKESRHLRNMGSFQDALAKAKHATYLRGKIYYADKTQQNLVAYAKSQTHLSRCLNDLNPNSSPKLLEALQKCCQSYRELYTYDPAFRLDLAMTLNNLALCQSEMGKQQGPEMIKERRKRMQLLQGAAKTAQEAVEHLMVLYTGEHVSGTEVVGAVVQSSHIHSDASLTEQALSLAKEAVSLCQKLSGNEAARMDLLGRAMLRVANCFHDLGRHDEAKAMERRAKAVVGR